LPYNSLINRHSGTTDEMLAPPGNLGNRKKMFLVVFVTLALSIIGLFAQVVTLQSAQINRSQSALAQTMLTWHAAAIKKALQNQSVVTAGNACLMTSRTAASGGENWYPPPPTACGFTVDSTALPTGYAMTAYSFDSILYKPSTAPEINYVITFVLPPKTNSSVANSSNSYITLPDPYSNGPQTSFKLSDLRSQFRRIGAANLSFGTVTTVAGQKQLTITANGNNIVNGTVQRTGTTLTYTLPQSMTGVLDGSLALISPAE
jgi:hypothetical protein